MRRPRRRLKPAKTVAVGCNRWPRPQNGKEGVDGSSPSEGLPKRPANGHLVLPAMARFRHFTGTRRVHFGTGGHSRARATSRDTAWDVLETLDRDHSLEKFLQAGGRRCPRWRDADSLLVRDVVIGTSALARAVVAVVVRSRQRGARAAASRISAGYGK